MHDHMVDLQRYRATSIKRNFVAVDREELKPNWKSGLHFYKWSPIIVFTFFSNTLRGKADRMIVFSCRHFPHILKYRDYWWYLLTIWKTRLLETYIEEFSWNVYSVCSASIFDESRPVMTFSTILEVTEILCSFR